MTLPFERLNAILAKLPSTNARIAVTLCCVALTAIAYCIAWQAPAGGWEAWLTFLAAMSGIDAAQFFAKRKTQQPPPPPNGTAGPPSGESSP